MAIAHRFVTVAFLALVLTGASCGTKENPPSSRAGGSAASTRVAAGARVADSTRVADSARTADNARAGGSATRRPAGPDSTSDPRAVSLAARVTGALGGDRAWESARCFCFSYVEGDSTRETLRRTHYWERTTNRHRMEGIDRQGRPLVVIHTLGDSASVLATRAGSLVTDPQETRALRAEAELAWVNDSFWLLAPFMLRESGVRLAYGGTKRDDDQDWDLIEVTFGPQGPAPERLAQGDRYWIYVDRATGFADRLAFVPDRSPAGSEPIVFEWSGWRRYGGIQLADRRRELPSRRRNILRTIRFPNLAVLDELPPATFSSPEPVTMPAL